LELVERNLGGKRWAMRQKAFQDSVVRMEGQGVGFGWTSNGEEFLDCN